MSATEIEDVVWKFNNSSEPWSPTSTDADWLPYPDIVSDMIEDAYNDNLPTVDLGKYYIELTANRMVQVGKENSWKQRPVRRTVVSETTAGPVRLNRFSFPDKPLTKSLGNPGVWMSPFVEKWIVKNPNYKYKEEQTLEQIAVGLELEGCKIGEDVQAKMVGHLVRKRKGQPKDQVIRYCVRLYTNESWIYGVVNKALREENMDKVENLGAFCCYIRSYLYERQKKAHGEMVVYRGMALDPKDIEFYKESLDEVKSWLSFASTSKNPDIAKGFLLNVPPDKVPTLFIIRFESEFSQYFPGRDISALSKYPDEEEVLLHPGADFRIKHVEENVKPSNWTIIHLALV